MVPVQNLYMKKLFTVISVFIFLQPGFAQPSFIKDSLENYITQGMKDWNIPGLAIAIVKNDSIVMMKGFGVRDIDTKEPVDENTLFMIASNSKLFTGTALAQLDYDHKLSLDDKITKHFPWFRVYDSTTTKLVTIKDMLGHHLGTKTFEGDFTFWNSTLSRDSVMYKMRYVKPPLSFRASYGYCNSCFLTAGQVLHQATGIPWEVYIYDSILAPLNMTNTHALGNGMINMPGAATPYTNAFTGTLIKLPYDNVDNLAPAGSMVSCVNDLSHWIMMQLDSGKYNNKQVLPWKVVQQTRGVNTLLSTKRNDELQGHFVSYGLGVFIRDMNGRQVYDHTGGADGFVTNVCFVPEEKLGITILTNNDNQEFFELLRYQILAAYLNMPYKNYSKESLPGFKAEQNKITGNINTLKRRVKGNAPDLPLSSYAGIYNNELFGKIYISAKGNNLEIGFDNHKNLTAGLQYMDNGEWLLSYNTIAYGIFPLRFLIKDKKVIATDIKVNDFLEYDPYTFVKEQENQ